MSIKAEERALALPETSISKIEPKHHPGYDTSPLGKTCTPEKILPLQTLENMSPLEDVLPSNPNFSGNDTPPLTSTAGYFSGYVENTIPLENTLTPIQPGGVLPPFLPPAGFLIPTGDIIPPMAGQLPPTLALPGHLPPPGHLDPTLAIDLPHHDGAAIGIGPLPGDLPQFIPIPHEVAIIDPLAPKGLLAEIAFFVGPLSTHLLYFLMCCGCMVAFVLIARILPSYMTSLCLRWGGLSNHFDSELLMILKQMKSFDIFGLGSVDFDIPLNIKSAGFVERVSNILKHAIGLNAFGALGTGAG